MDIKNLINLIINKYMETLLLWLSGKKGAIASVIGLVVAYLATQGVLGEAEVVLIMGISGVLFGTASHYTGKLYN